MKSFFYILLDISGRHDYNLFLFYSPTQAKKRPKKKESILKTKGKVKLKVIKTFCIVQEKKKKKKNKKHVG